jgi:hypothetical protein
MNNYIHENYWKCLYTKQLGTTGTFDFRGIEKRFKITTISIEVYNHVCCLYIYKDCLVVLMWLGCTTQYVLLN